jgi:hypothetical protein
MCRNLIGQVRDAILDAAPLEPLVSVRDRETAVRLLWEAIDGGDAVRKVVRLAAAVELRASISDELWASCRVAANDSGDAALFRLYRSARGRSFVLVSD